MKPSTLLLLALSTPTLLAQSVVVPAGTSPTDGICNSFPFNTTDMRYQALLTASDLGGAPAVISGFSLAPCASGVRSMRSITVRMAHFNGATMSTTFDSNLNSPGPVLTVLDTVDHDWHLQADTWNDVGLQSPFLYDGANNLVVEILVRGTGGISGAMHREGTNQRVYLGGYTNQPVGRSSQAAFKMRVLMGDASTQAFGTGCVGSNGVAPEFSLGGTAQIGTNLDLVCDRALPNTLALFFVGAGNQRPAFPIDLTAAGAPGCWLYHSIGATVPQPTDGAGSTRLTFALPQDPNLVHAIVYASALVLDPAANAAAAVTSNYGRILIGN